MKLKKKIIQVIPTFRISPVRGHKSTMGVVTVADIDYGQIFGPFPTHITATNPAYIIGMLTRDKQPEGVVLKVSAMDLY